MRLIVYKQTGNPNWKPGQSGNPSGLPGRTKGIIDRQNCLNRPNPDRPSRNVDALTVKEKVDWATKNMGQFMAMPQT